MSKKLTKIVKIKKEDTTYDGVLGGYGFVNPMDIADSEKMIDYLVQNMSMIPKLALGNIF